MYPDPAALVQARMNDRLREADEARLARRVRRTRRLESATGPEATGLLLRVRTRAAGFFAPAHLRQA